MVRVFLRAALFGSVVLALWSLARPASAAIAPLCDDRGASAIAPPPVLQAPDDARNEAIERAHVAPSCTRGDLPLGASVAPLHKGAPKLTPAAERALPFAPIRFVPPVRDEPPAAASTVRPPDGVRSRVERPPRG